MPSDLVSAPVEKATSPSRTQTEVEPTVRGRQPPRPGVLGVSVGFLLIACAMVGIAANFRLPWLSIAGGNNSTRLLFWGDIRGPQALAYEQRLLLWPLAAYLVLALVGVVTLIRTLPAAQSPKVWAVLTPASVWSVAFSGFLLTLTGTRWLGFQTARLLDSGPATARLQAAPYLNLGFGIIFLGVAAWRIARSSLPNARADAGRVPRLWAAAAPCLALLLLPVIPYAKLTLWGGVDIWVDEFTIAVLASQDGAEGGGAPEALGSARLMLWGALYVSAFSCLVAEADAALQGRKPWARLRHAVAVNFLVISAGFGFTALFYERLPDLQGFVFAVPNPMLPLAFAAVTAASVWYLKAVLRTRPRELRAGSGSAADGLLRRGRDPC